MKALLMNANANASLFSPTSSMLPLILYLSKHTHWPAATPVSSSHLSLCTLLVPK